MDRWQYLLVLAACLVITAPLEVLGTGVCRQPRRAVRAIAPVAIVLNVRDVLAIALRSSSSTTGTTPAASAFRSTYRSRTSSSVGHWSLPSMLSWERQRPRNHRETAITRRRK
ncbi:MAG: hypothetical protein ABW001_09260 [Mycobacterium sp.]